ncbi:hypothetical protein SAMN05421671_4136 [Pimelobacter simplex]|nr:hypothetical protein SAMN05421671_4136 [Pimelobacter simplex]
MPPLHLVVQGPRWEDGVVDEQVSGRVFCHVCEQVTDHVDKGDETVAADGDIVIPWMTCAECGADNLA